MVVLVLASGYMFIFQGFKIALELFGWTSLAIVVLTLFTFMNIDLIKDSKNEQRKSFQLANVLTSFRIISTAPVLVLLLEGFLLAGALLYIVAAVTDIFDGMAARGLDQGTRYGLVLDPVGDILVTAAVFGYFWIDGDIPPWLFVILMFRYVQFFAGLAVLDMLGKRPRLRATIAGKLVGLVQASGILIIFAGKLFPESVPFGEMNEYLFPVLGAAFVCVVISQTWIGVEALKNG